MNCAECEAMLTDFIDGTLPAKDKAAFDLHIATCKECSQMLADTQRGAALLEMLKSPRPEPSPALLERILAHTSAQTSAQIAVHSISQPAGAAAQAGGINLVPGMQAIEAAPAGPLGPAPVLAVGAPLGNVIPFRPRPASIFNLQAIGRTLMQPRLAMTAAMAFFSIALTLNLTGVHLNELRASDVKPSNLKRSFYQADASLVRYYENLRVVYELESRLSDLKQSNDSDGSGASSKPASKGDDSGPATPDSGKDGSKSGQQQKPSPKAGSGTSQRSNPLQPEFKLVRNRSARPSGSVLMAANRDVLSEYTNRSKEMIQEGGSV
jgi:hypothetical protein